MSLYLCIVGIGLRSEYKVLLTAVYLAYACEATTAQAAINSQRGGEIPGSKTGPMEEEARELYGAVKLLRIAEATVGVPEKC